MVNIAQPPRYADGSILVGGALPRCQEGFLRFSVIEPWHVSCKLRLLGDCSFVASILGVVSNEYSSASYCNHHRSRCSVKRIEPITRPGKDSAANGPKEVAADKPQKKNAHLEYGRPLQPNAATRTLSRTCRKANASRPSCVALAASSLHG